MVSFTSSRGWSRAAITRASASHESSLMRPATRPASSGSASHWSPKRITSGGRRTGRLRGSADHVCRTAPALRDDLHRAFAQARGSPWPSPRTCSTGSVWGSRPSARMRASSSRAWTTRMPACSPSPFPIHPGNRPWPSSPAAVSGDSSGGNGEPSCVPRCGSRSGKHLDFLLPRGQADCEPITLPFSCITGWPLRWHRGSGSKSAAARRRS